jgi:hypothetical protein
MNQPNSKQIARLRQPVTSDPEIMRGTPVFKGTRIPVDLVADMLAQGATAEDSHIRMNAKRQAVESLSLKSRVEAQVPSNETKPVQSAPDRVA